MFLHKKNKLNLSFLLDLGFFRKVYVIVLFFEMIAFLDSIFVLIRYIVLSWGTFVVAYNFFVIPRFKQIKYFRTIILFILLGILTAFINFSKEFPQNLVLVYHSVICFFVFFGMHSENNFKKNITEMVFVFKFMLTASSFFSSISIVILLLKSNLYIFSRFLGVFQNRLIGVYINSNLLAFSMVVAIVSQDVLISMGLFKSRKFKIIFNILLLFLNTVSLFLSDSNASFLFIIIYLTMRIFCSFFTKNNLLEFKNILRGSTYVFFSAIFLTAVAFTIRAHCQNFISAMLLKSRQITADPFTDDVDGVMQTGDLSINNYIPKIKIGRNNYDISSGRFVLVKQGLKLFKANPVFGIGRANFTIYGEKYLENGLLFSDLHNGYLTLLVSYGVVGFVILSLFSFFVMIDLLKAFIKIKNTCYLGVYLKLFSALIAYLVYSVLEKTILSEISFMVIYVWMILGYLFVLCDYSANLKNERGLYEF